MLIKNIIELKLLAVLKRNYVRNELKMKPTKITRDMWPNI
jgi:hypothetical protein